MRIGVVGVESKLPDEARLTHLQRQDHGWAASGAGEGDLVTASVDQIALRSGLRDQAVALLEPRWGNTELLAGGTDLHDLQKEYVAQPTRVVSLSGVKGFAGIETDNQNPPRWIRIGAGTKLADLAAHEGLRTRFAGLVQAASEIGGPQIRNMGTLGGSLCQRNRCWYFRDEHVNCLLKGGARCYAVDGENRYHAIFIQGRCVIVNPSTLAPPLIALGATAEVVGVGNLIVETVDEGSVLVFIERREPLPFLCASERLCCQEESHYHPPRES